MDNHVIYPIIHWLQQHCSAECYTVLYLIFSGGLLLLSQRLLGLLGLYIFNALALLAANIQVLGFTRFAYLPEPIALGIVTSTVTFLGSDIITEHYGTQKAQLGIFISLTTQALFMLILLGGMGYTHTNVDIESAIQQLFIPGPRIIASSVIAYAISQYVDIHLFKLIKQWCQARYLWVRTAGSMTLSGAVDTFIFGLFAWVILNPHPVSLQHLFLSYMLIGYLMRIFVQSLAIPVIYLSYYTKPTREHLVSEPMRHDILNPPLSQQVS